jgi:nicotinamidase/pyrazinamidase
MKPETTLFYDVDTQHDFLHPEGKLYVEGAKRIVPALAEVTQLARKLGCRIVASVDRHFPGDPELRSSGGEFENHCMSGSPGQRKIPATAPLAPHFVENRNLSEEETRNALAHQGELVIEKQRFDVFSGNRNADALLHRLLRDYTDVVVYGVYTEVCVDGAVRGLSKIGPKIHVVTDAIADIGAEGERYRDEWRTAGIELVTLAELKRRFESDAAQASRG